MLIHDHDDCSDTVQRGQLRSLTGSSKLSSTVACHVPVVLAVCEKNTIYKCYPVYYSTVRDHAQVYSFNTDIYILFVNTFTEHNTRPKLNAQNSEQRGRMDNMIDR